jgi:xylulokinase
MPLYLGLDSSTQSLTVVVLAVETAPRLRSGRPERESKGDRRRVVFESSLTFDQALPQYGTRHGVLQDDDPSVAVSSPLMWAEALDVMLARVASSGVDLSRVAAIAGSAQQHGSVYLNGRAEAVFASLDPARAIVDQIAGTLSRPVSPIWMDSSTSAECREIEAEVGGRAALAHHTGSRAFERFTGPQIRKFFKRERDAYTATDRVHLVSSFLASLLAGQHAPIDPGDGSGMNLMDLSTRQWWPAAVDATAPGLSAKLPPIALSATVVGRLSPYWQKRHGLPAAKIVAWSGDNPCSLIGTGLVDEGRVAISLGTSDTIFGLMREPRVDPTGTGHVFGSPTGDYMGITVFKNGSLARERIRDAFGLTWPEFSRALAATPPGNQGRILLPWFEPEITPDVPTPGVHRFGLSADDGPGNVRGVVEAQQMALALHSRWMGVKVATIHATGGASANRDILQVMADVFGADVYQFEVGNSACLGAALRAFHADAASEGRPVAWDDVVKGLAEPVTASRVQPDPARHLMYGGLMRMYAECEERARLDPRRSATQS